MEIRKRRLVAAVSLAVTAAVLMGGILLLPGCGATGPTDGTDLGRNRNWAGAYMRVHLVPEQKPQLGEYSSRSQEVIQRHVEWAQQASIDFFAVSWRGMGSYGHTSLVDHVLPESSFDTIQWCILYETPTVIEGDPDASTINLTMAARDTLIRHLLDFHDNFFSRSNYLHIDGRPVIILRQSRRIAGEPWIALNAVRQAYMDSTGGGSYYLVGDEAMWGALAIPNTDRIRAMDAITGIDLGVMSQHDGYPQGTGFINDLTTMWHAYSAAGQVPEPPVPLIPMVWPGFNDRASSQIQHPVIAREVTSGTEQNGSTYGQMWIVANEQIGDPAIVLLNSFNAWQQDTQIEPVADNGNGLGTTLPATMTGRSRYFPYQESFVENTVIYKGNVLLGAIYEIWYDNKPPSGY